MIKILPISTRVLTKVNKHRLESKFRKQLVLLSQNPKHPSLHVELLEPHEAGIYSFRVDLKYRGLFIFRPDKQAIEVLTITVHYH